MVEEMRAETVDMIVTACEKYPGNYEVKFLFASTPLRDADRPRYRLHTGGGQVGQGSARSQVRQLLACRHRRGLCIRNHARDAEFALHVLWRARRCAGLESERLI